MLNVQWEREREREREIGFVRAKFVQHGHVLGIVIRLDKIGSIRLIDQASERKTR